MNNFERIYQNNEDQFLKFENVKIKFCSRPDLHAFILLDQLFPGNKDIIQCAGHDQIWLDVNEEQIKSIPGEYVLDLIKCGVFYNEESLTMHV